MNGPKFRFTIVMSFVLVLWWAYGVAKAYLIGEHGLNIPHYISSASMLLGLAFAGYALIWLMLRGANWNKNGLTGFEPSVTDEYGTEFRMGKRPFPLRLSRLLPAHMESIPPEQMSQLEYEILGFLSSLRHLPSAMGHGNLYEAALRRWELVRKLPNFNTYHACFALALELGVFYTLQEKRTTHSWKRFWEADSVRTEPRAELHGGLSAFILSVLPSFRATANTTSEEKAKRRALLAALQTAEAPQLLPTNTHPMGQELLQLLDVFKAAESQIVINDAQLAAWANQLAAEPEHISRALTQDLTEMWKLNDAWVLVEEAPLWHAMARHLGVFPSCMDRTQIHNFVLYVLHMINTKNPSFHHIYTTQAIHTWALPEGPEKALAALYVEAWKVAPSFLETLPSLPAGSTVLLDDASIAASLTLMGQDMRGQLAEAF